MAGVSPEQRVLADFNRSLTAAYEGLLSNFVTLKVCAFSCPVRRLAERLYKYKLAAQLAVYDEKTKRAVECCSEHRSSSYCSYKHCRHIGIIFPSLTPAGCDSEEPHYNVQLGVDIIVQHILVDGLRELAGLRTRQQLQAICNDFKGVASLFNHGEHRRSYIMTDRTAARLKLYLPDFDVPADATKLFMPACEYLVRRYWKKCRILIVREEYVVGEKKEQLQQLLPLGCVVTVELTKRPVHYYYEPWFRLYETTAHTHFVADITWVGTYLLNDQRPIWVHTSPG